MQSVSLRAAGNSAVNSRSPSAAITKPAQNLFEQEAAARLIQKEWRNYRSTHATAIRERTNQVLIMKQLNALIRNSGSAIDVNYGDRNNSIKLPEKKPINLLQP
jgi:hypothetical protein